MAEVEELEARVVLLLRLDDDLHLRPLEGDKLSRLLNDGVLLDRTRLQSRKNLVGFLSFFPK